MDSDSRNYRPDDLAWAARLGRRLQHSTNFLGLNQTDRDRISAVGFARWFLEACDNQARRLSAQKNHATLKIAHPHHGPRSLQKEKRGRTSAPAKKRR